MSMISQAEKNREKSRNRRGCQHSVDSHRIRGPLLTSHVTHNIIIWFTQTLSPRLSPYNALGTTEPKEEMILELSTYLIYERKKKKDWLITLHIQLRIRCVFRHLLIHELSAPQFIHNHYNTDSFTPDSQLTLLTYKTPVISTYDTKAAFMALFIYTDYVKAAHLPSEVLFKPSIKIQLFFLPPLITALVSIFF